MQQDDLNNTFYPGADVRPNRVCCSWPFADSYGGLSVLVAPINTPWNEARPVRLFTPGIKTKQQIREEEKAA